MNSEFTDKTLSIILRDVKNSLLKHCMPLKFLIIGSNKHGIINNTDIDIVIIVKDNIDLFTLSEKIAPTIRDLILKYNFFISVFPISEKYYILQNTQFISNVIEKGIEF